jgi:stage V sporulation protein SpoVS
MIEIPALVISAWTLIQPYLPVIATKAAEGLGQTAVAKVWTTIEKRFEAKPAAKEALTDLLKTPQDADVQGAFRSQLKKLLEEDHAFAGDLAQLLQSAGSDYKAQVLGDGAIAQGEGAIALGKGAVHIGGNNTMVTGDKNSVNSEKKKR